MNLTKPLLLGLTSQEGPCPRGSGTGTEGPQLRYETAKACAEEGAIRPVLEATGFLKKK